MSKEVEVFEKILDNRGNQHMLRWNLNGFKLTYPRLYKVIIDSMSDVERINKTVKIDVPDLKIKIDVSYTVERHIMFFCRGEVVAISKLREYFTDKSIEDFIKCGYLKLKI